MKSGERHLLARAVVPTLTSPYGNSAKFTRRVLAAVRSIPHGRVATYADVASIAGSPLAWSAVGNIMRNCKSSSVPCHRVVGSGGHIGGYSILEVKRKMLLMEGVVVIKKKVRQFEKIRWRHV